MTWPDGIALVIGITTIALLTHTRREHTMTTTEHRKLTQDELVTEARNRFGDDPMKWAFVCPSCGDIANGEDFRQALTANPRTNRNSDAVIASDVIGQECIGRTLGALAKRNGKYAGRGCDWAAYGLFSGPWEITLPNGRIAYGFALAPAA
ncbi:VVA0879 family protein [Streptomyces misionensis]|uniref:VVA0879 family protein n=1 Tax=Streptomyces misionensis TaxID=67331 RepID=UPI00396B7199